MKLSGDRCQCAACREHFNSTYAFDKHRVGAFSPMHRQCTAPAGMQAKGMLKNAAGFWISASKPIRASGEGVPAAIDPDPCGGSPPKGSPRPVAAAAERTENMTTAPLPLGRAGYPSI